MRGEVAVMSNARRREREHRRDARARDERSKEPKPDTVRTGAELESSEGLEPEWDDEPGVHRPPDDS
jgi:hypothetical protein